MKNPKTVELLAPAGGFEQLSAALNSGADAVYFGVGELNMRAGGAVNFQVSDLPGVAARCHEAGVRAYLTVNTVLYDDELPAVRELCNAAKNAGIDACIAGDMAAVLYLRSIGMPLHMTVQCNICNLEAVRFYSQFADVMVLARELPLASIFQIIEGIKRDHICGPSGNPVRVEVFAHGALCVAISGKCYMSLCSYNRSANRGKCLQNCRRNYTVRDTETGVELAIDNHYVMSPKDLCTVDFLDKILDAGVSVLKIEGRGRAADYVAKTVRVYREAVDSFLTGSFDRSRIPEWRARLEEVFNRGFWTGGYYLGKKLDEWCATDGNRATIVKTYLGRVTNYFSRLGVAEIRVEAKPLHVKDRLLVTGATTGAVEMEVSELRLDGSPADCVPTGGTASLPVPEKFRNSDKVYLLERREPDRF